MIGSTRDIFLGALRFCASKKKVIYISKQNGTISKTHGFSLDKKWVLFSRQSNRIRPDKKTVLENQSPQKKLKLSTKNGLTWLIFSDGFRFLYEKYY